MHLNTMASYLGYFYIPPFFTHFTCMLFEEVTYKNSKATSLCRLLGIYASDINTLYPMHSIDSNDTIMHFPQLKNCVVKADIYDNLLLSIPLSSLYPINTEWTVIFPQYCKLHYVFPNSKIHWFVPQELFLLAEDYIYEGTPLQRSHVSTVNQHFVFQLVIQESIDGEQKLFYRLSHYYNADREKIEQFDTSTSNKIIKTIPALQRLSYPQDNEGFTLIEENDCSLNLQLLDYNSSDFNTNNPFLNNIFYFPARRNRNLTLVSPETIRFLLGETAVETEPAAISTTKKKPTSLRWHFFEGNSTSLYQETPSKKKARLGNY